ncbi:MAG: hypothetical protein EPN86_00725 [Nanoarchaeota archaeon]|nr:MAG: hypothetical protein EPN86_00725 [Nanoarchaeota archaeon]
MRKERLRKQESLDLRNMKKNRKTGNIMHIMRTFALFSYLVCSKVCTIAPENKPSAAPARMPTRRSPTREPIMIPTAEPSTRPITAYDLSETMCKIKTNPIYIGSHLTACMCAKKKAAKKTSKKKVKVDKELIKADEPEVEAVDAEVYGDKEVPDTDVDVESEEISEEQ